jgi:hypothetical protein
LQEFNGSGPAVKPNKIIDLRISSPLFLLPVGTIAGFEQGQPISLPQRNLLRQVTWSLPSGQRVAREIGVEPVNVPQFHGLNGAGFDLEWSSPLWAYCLHEAFAVENGLHLGPVGGTIVGEVIIGLLELGAGQRCPDGLSKRKRVAAAVPYGTAAFPSSLVIFLIAALQFPALGEPELNES